jgi:hypothetical protein
LRKRFILSEQAQQLGSYDERGAGDDDGTVEASAQGIRCHVERTIHVILSGTVRIRAVSAERAIELLEGNDDVVVSCDTIMALVDKNGGAQEETGDCEECWHPTGEVDEVG